MVGEGHVGDVFVHWIAGSIGDGGLICRTGMAVLIEHALLVIWLLFRVDGPGDSRELACDEDRGLCFGVASGKIAGSQFRKWSGLSRGRKSRKIE